MTFDSLDLGAPGPATLGTSSIQLSSSFSEDEFELDPDFLSATAEMRKLKIGLGDPGARGWRARDTERRCGCDHCARARAPRSQAST